MGVPANVFVDKNGNFCDKIMPFQADRSAKAGE
jgi:hypothetical protein